MNIRLLSDLHMEFWKKYPVWVRDKGDVLILAGDIHVGVTNVSLALEMFSKNYNHVIYLPGNHEFYGQSIDCLEGMIVPDNVYVLNPGSITIDYVTFIGAPLWTNFNNDLWVASTARKYIHDFKRIKDFTVRDCANLFNKHFAFLQEATKAPGKKVIITHFMPSMQCVHPRWFMDVTTRVLNSYFANDLDEFILQLEDTPYWFFGHTHDTRDVLIGNTRCISNPYGYGGTEINNFKENYDIVL